MRINFVFVNAEIFLLHFGCDPKNVKENMKLYLYSPSGPSWPILG
jgi:hypothetical protein